MAAPAIAAAAGSAAKMKAIGAGFQTLSDLGSASGSGNQLGYGIGAKILGAPGDPAGAIYQMILSRRARKEKERQFNKTFGLQQRQMAINEMIANIQKQKHEDERQRKMSFRNAMMGI